MVRLLPKHNTDHSPLTRHTSVYTVEVDGGATAKAVSSVIVYQNLLDGINSHIDAGESRLFLVGKYHDTFKIEDNKAAFLSREVRIERIVIFADQKQTTFSGIDVRVNAIEQNSDKR